MPAVCVEHPHGGGLYDRSMPMGVVMDSTHMSADDVGVREVEQVVDAVIADAVLKVRLTYNEWIADWLHGNNPYTRCREAVVAIVAAFPELEKVPGHVLCPAPWGQRVHWWAKAPDGTIVDPTASQFPAILAYEAWTPGAECIMGSCYSCGDDIYRPVWDLENPPPRESTCSVACEKAAHADLTADIASYRI